MPSARHIGATTQKYYCHTAWHRTGRQPAKTLLWSYQRIANAPDPANDLLEVRGRKKKLLRLNSGNQKNRVMNRSRCSDHNLPDRYRTGSKNGHGAQQVYPSRMGGVLKRDHPSGSADVWSKIPKGIVPEGDT